jgi:hypothetical protein
MRDPHMTKLGEHALSPQSLMMGYGYNPRLSEGSLKPPEFMTSTFVFRSAQDGKDRRQISGFDVEFRHDCVAPVPRANDGHHPGNPSGRLRSALPLPDRTCGL